MKLEINGFEKMSLENVLTQYANMVRDKAKEAGGGLTAYYMEDAAQFAESIRKRLEIL